MPRRNCRKEPPKPEARRCCSCKNVLGYETPRCRGIDHVHIAPMCMHCCGGPADA